MISRHRVAALGTSGDVPVEIFSPRDRCLWSVSSVKDIGAVSAAVITGTSHWSHIPHQAFTTSRNKE